VKKVLVALLGAFSMLALVQAQGPGEPGKNTTARTVNVGDLKRTYYLHVPPKLAKEKPVPLVLMFHGGGGTPFFAERESKFSDLADREGFLVAYPEGVGKSWNDGRGIQGIPAQREKVDDVGFIKALLDDVGKDYKVDAKRVYSTGISNGALISYFLGVNLSNRIAAIAPVVGGMPETLVEKFKPEKPVSVIILQGTADPLMPYNGGDITVPPNLKRGKIISTEDSVKKWVEHNGCQRDAVKDDVPDKDPKDGCTVKRFRYPKGKDGTEVVLYKIEPGGHTWPGGFQYLPEKVIGKLCKDLDGTETIWEFFKKHPKP